MTTRTTLRFTDVVAIVVSLVIGMGIFRAPATVAARAGSVELFYAAWLVGSVVAMCGAIVFANIGRRLPVTGAYFRIFAKAYHPSIAFAINAVILVSNAASAAGVAIIGADYFAPLLPHVEPTIVAAAMVAVLYALNLAGLRASATAQNTMIAIKVAMLVAIVAAVLFVPSADSQHGIASVVANVATSPWAAFGMALLAVSFTYGGYQSTINFGGEVANVRRLPLAIILGVVIVTMVYMGVNAAYLHILGFDTLAASQNIAALVVERAYGPTGSSVLTAVLVVSVLGYVNVSMLANPRVITAMSQDGMAPASIAKGDAAGGLRQWSLLGFSVVCVLSVFIGRTFEVILNYTMFVDAIGLALGAATFYRLAGPRRSVAAHGAAVIFIASCLYTAANIFLFDTTAGIAGTCLVLVLWLVGLFIAKPTSTATAR
jgi:APA family basic amino acid/polyamine antiporter